MVAASVGLVLIEMLEDALIGSNLWKLVESLSILSMPATAVHLIPLEFVQSRSSSTTNKPKFRPRTQCNDHVESCLPLRTYTLLR